jgi:hypothetical protein
MAEVDEVFEDSKESQGEEAKQPDAGKDGKSEQAKEGESAPPADEDGKENAEDGEESKEAGGADSAKSGEPDAQSKENSEDEKPFVPVAALKDERAKRQAAESEVKTLKERIAKNDKGQTPEEADVNDDTFKERAVTSRELMTELVPDYEDKEKVFLAECEKNPALAIQLRKSKNPAKFAYNTGKEIIEHQQYLEEKNSDQYKEFQEFKKNPTAYAAKKAEEAEKAKNKQLEETPEDKRKKSALSVPNLNKATSVKVDSAKEEVGGLDELMEGSPF